jgi:hypothetical protein
LPRSPSQVWRERVREIAPRWRTWVRHLLLFHPRLIPLDREDK